ncbi:MAG: alpha/beta hydrolase [Clostridia bacterium]|jgi:pimeloyl-ACP methyl ester carboxylesterase|nr:alpha/beta hydrolase [Clostridia bacterium]
MKKILISIMKIVGIIIIVIIVLLFVLTIVNNILTISEKEKYINVGKYVIIDGKRMNIYSKINDNKKDTIILLSGYGNSSPVLDFMPLTNELSKNYNVAIVEYFGYGWSDKTDKERTSNNIIEETRAALKQSGINPPYILMPHSISGIYSLYYANKYPDEVKAIIGIDPSVPAQMYYVDLIKKKSKLEKLVTTTGIVRAITKINPSIVQPKSLEGVYSSEDLNLIRIMYCWNNSNESLINEYNNMLKNMQETENYRFQSNIPVLFFLSKQSINVDTEIGKNWIKIHENLISNIIYKKITILNGPHHLYWTDFKQISEETYQFLNRDDK